MRQFKLIPTILLAATMLTSCDTRHYRQCNGAAWGTTYHITYKSDRDLTDSINHVLRLVEQSLSPFSETSIISQINRGELPAVDSMITQVFTASKEISAKSGGMFDPTVAPLVNLWGFGYKDLGEEPEKEQIDSVLPLVGIDGCCIADGRIVKKHPLTEFNFSAIAKGYGCDMIGEMLRRNRCNDYMVEIGGEIILAGTNPRNKPWRIMLDAPIDNDSTAIHKPMVFISVTDCGLATSGNYRNFKTGEKGKIGHTISPIDGMPIISATLSVTVVASSSMRADALATACMAMPLDRAKEMIEAEPDAAALFVTADSASGAWQTITTSRFPIPID